MATRGLLVIITGGNGVGKDTIAPILAERMRKVGVQAQSLYGPGANDATLALQEIILQKATSPRSHLSQALTFFALHAESAETVIVPKLECGESIVLNRGPDTTLAYNVLGRNLTEKHPELLALYEQIYGTLKPDLVVLLDTSVEISLSRAAQQSGTDQFQQQANAAHEQRRLIYLQLAEKYNWTIVDATSGIEEVTDKVWHYIEQMLKEK